ncbi:MAG TPA: 50S ribosomal protein L15, partial [Gemmatimonadetes bacterium]|nr:50S ribosomal protein L15 [Gemmatimonadota bacterium]
RRNPKRLGRGQGSGTGKTAGRGQKGAGSRAGHKSRAGFEGGQMPLHRRIPKRGFKNFARVEYQVVNVRDFKGLTGTVTPESLKTAGLIASLRRPVKVLGSGELGGSLSVSAHAFSKSAREKIEGAGGSVVVLNGVGGDDRAVEAAEPR